MISLGLGWAQLHCLSREWTQVLWVCNIYVETSLPIEEVRNTSKKNIWSLLQSSSKYNDDILIHIPGTKANYLPKPEIRCMVECVLSYKDHEKDMTKSNY